jgi:acyl phosphate:glycerol-3-phosphate acyltransferase
MMRFLLSLLAYLLGSVPFGYIIVKIKEGVDVRSTGSGNIGATNVLRASGPVSSVLTLLLDAMKGYLAVWIASWATQQDRRAMALSAVAVVLGHIFPVYLRFKGGKGVATALGVFLYLAVVPIMLTAILFLMLVARWRYMSAGSIGAAMAFPLLYYFWEFAGEYPAGSSLWLLCAVIACSILVISKHHENIQRLIAGTERKLGAR